MFFRGISSPDFIQDFRKATNLAFRELAIRRFQDSQTFMVKTRSNMSSSSSAEGLAEQIAQDNAALAGIAKIPAIDTTATLAINRDLASDLATLAATTPAVVNILPAATNLPSVTPSAVIAGGPVDASNLIPPSVVIPVIVPEPIPASIDFNTGQSREDSHRIAQRFRQHNLELFEKMHPHYKDRTKLIAVVKQGRQQLEEQMAEERAQAAHAHAKAAHSEARRSG